VHSCWFRVCCAALQWLHVERASLLCFRSFSSRSLSQCSQFSCCLLGVLTLYFDLYMQTLWKLSYWTCSYVLQLSWLYYWILLTEPRNRIHLALSVKTVCHLFSMLTLVVCGVAGMFGLDLLSSSVFIWTFTAKTVPNGTPSSKTGCCVYARDLSGLSLCRIYIMLYS